MLEKNVGRKVLVILEPSHGIEGTLIAVSHNPPGIWLSNADAVIMRATIAQPIPQVVAREDRSEVFVNLKDVQRIEVLHKK
jgi:predicted aconitase with swiveling domain